MPVFQADDLVAAGDQIEVRWRGEDSARTPAVSVAVGATPWRARTAAPLIPRTARGAAVVPRAGLRTFVTLTELSSGERIVVGERQMRIAGMSNLRDIGGYTVPGGGRTEWSVLLRGAAPAFGPDGDIEAELAELHLRSIIDLRPDDEAGLSPAAWPETLRGHLHRIGIRQGVDGVDTSLLALVRTGELRRFGTGELTAYYVRSLDNLAAEYGAVVTELGTPGRLPSLVHCAAGKDRTGIVVALVLSICGVDRTTIVQDYAATERYRPNRLEVFRTEFEGLGLVAEELAALFLSPAEAMAGALAHLDTRHGSVERYLTDAAGVPAAAIERLRSALVLRTR